MKASIDVYSKTDSIEYRSDARAEARHEVEEEMTKAVLRYCKRCKYGPFGKDDGCNCVKCPKCKYQHCFACGNEVTDYASHFGQGKPCPLQEDTMQRHKKEAAEAQERTIRKVLEKQPDLREEDVKVESENGKSIRRDRGDRTLPNVIPRVPVVNNTGVRSYNVPQTAYPRWQTPQTEAFSPMYGMVPVVNNPGVRPYNVPQTTYPRWQTPQTEAFSPMYGMGRRRIPWPDTPLPRTQVKVDPCGLDTHWTRAQTPFDTGFLPFPQRHQIAPIHAEVTTMLHDPILQGLNLPPYPPPAYAIHPVLQIRDKAWKSGIVSISRRLHRWTRIFEKKPIEFNSQCLGVIKTCLQKISDIDPGLLPFTVDNMDIRTIVRFISADRRLFVEHILALHIYTSILLPFYVNVSKRLFAITDRLHRDRTSFLVTSKCSTCR